MSSQVCRSVASRAARSILSAYSKQSSRAISGGRAAAAAATVSLRGVVPSLAAYGREESANASRAWISGLFALPAAAYMLQEQEACAAEMERTFIAIKPDGVQRGLIAEIISRFERKGFKLVGIKILVPSKDFAKKHYHDLKERPFFNGLCDFLSSGPVIGMVWEGEGVIKYGRKLIGATDPQKSEPGTIRGDLAVVVGRNIIHGSDGPETAKDEIALWFKPEELPLNVVSIPTLCLSPWRLRLSTLSSLALALDAQSLSMATKPLTSETIALTEKKMDMTLDDIIKMSKNNSNKSKSKRVSNRSQKTFTNATQDKSGKIRKFMDTRSSLRQGALAQRRSSFQGNQFPLATEAAKKAATAPIRSRGFSRNRTGNMNKRRVAAPLVQRNVANGGGFSVKPKPQTLDSLFANMKEQRMKTSQQTNGARKNGRSQHQAPWIRRRFGN
nr:Nucleoside diphosphate kinase [Ipomoea trifida]